MAPEHTNLEINCEDLIPTQNDIFEEDEDDDQTILGYDILTQESDIDEEFDISRMCPPTAHDVLNETPTLHTNSREFKLTRENENLIREVMSNIKIPEANFPTWAQLNNTDEDWIGRLKQIFSDIITENTIIP